MVLPLRLQVFTSEQVAYSKADLNVHIRSGDVTGPMAEAGFKGHPTCTFCRKHFYGDNELFAHMQSTHEQCFLCRRARPDKHVYYRDYAELEGASATSSRRTTPEGSQIELYRKLYF